MVESFRLWNGLQVVMIVQIVVVVHVVSNKIYFSPTFGYIFGIFKAEIFGVWQKDSSYPAINGTHSRIHLLNTTK